MKKLKKLFISAVALMLCFVCVFSLTACGEEISEAKLNISIYDYTEKEMEDYSMDIDLYGHLAPKTVSAISSYINEGYYNGTVFYKTTEQSNQIMLGDLKYDPELAENEGFYLNAVKPNIEGEFTHGGTTGSNLKNKKGSIGLWRSWSAQDVSYNMGRTGTDSGEATWFIPTSKINAYDDYFCVFAQFELSGDNLETLTALENIFKNATYYQEYVIYYTGEYGNLTFNCVKKDDFKEDKIQDLFVAEEGTAQLVKYNHYTIQVPMTEDGQVAAYIKTATVNK